MQEERFGTRDITYGAWHRRRSTRRFVGIEKAQLMAMIDLDGALEALLRIREWAAVRIDREAANDQDYGKRSD